MKILEVDYAPYGLPDNKIKEIAKFIKKNAQPWLKETHNGQTQFYRGIRALPAAGSINAFIRNTRDDRRPAASDSDQHKAFNALIQAAGGIANRSNSVFVSSSEAVASVYGRTYVCMPLGDFNYTWSPKWADWTYSSYDIGSLLDPSKCSGNTIDLQDPNNYDKSKLSEYIKVDVDLLQAVKREVMVYCKQALYINPHTYFEVKAYL